MRVVRIAFRNVFRNRRRSLMTLMTVAMGGIAVLLLGALLGYIVLDFQTSTVKRVGHLTVYKKGYTDFGSGNPVAYGIGNYAGVQKLIESDPELAPMIAVATPMQVVFGIAGNYDKDVSKTFFGEGIVPADRTRMQAWNDYGFRYLPPGAPLRAADSAIVGMGLGRMLGLCKELHIPRCRPVPPPERNASAPIAPPQDFSALIAQEAQAGGRTAPAPAHASPRIDVLAATAGGAPNVVSVTVDRADSEGIKELDDNYLVMQLKLAQDLLYGRGEHKVTGIVIQLHHTADVLRARAGLNRLFQDHGLDLEIRDYEQLTPFYKQVINFFAFIFTFIAIIISVIVLFTIVNTMSMSVMERTSEIGTCRALGVQRSEIWAQFVVEGLILGLTGATLSVLAAALIVGLINASGLMWTPPSNVDKVPFRLYLDGNWPLIAGTWGVLVVVATIASFAPASRSGRKTIVDALRHV
ncbi:ABC transporter permease [Burkholderia sp. Bp9010]|nr:ABC transporter permease [Burkholderia sp. Bp9012]RQR77849.1 ABC transporter permease [Burkholderia sp. Bp9011]RQR87845.1 ABC transporter permease [Burkholderia sp. Bp9010]RQZ43785.1 ABC transporter permease [Burkholderia sp. Bp9099]